MKTWNEVEKKIVQSKYGPIEVPTKDCLMPDGRNIYITVKMIRSNNEAGDLK